MTVAETITRKLSEALAPSEIQVVDDSARHAGHSGARPGGETHFNVTLVAAAFAGKSRLERQRLVHAILSDELAGPVHALSLRLIAPDEAGRPAP
ncbi:MAG: BolA family transcriptional regulator [Rhodospirillales bacterium]|nr:BolA family transcriptional regulator [Rhodospirillales bacterium]